MGDSQKDEKQFNLQVHLPGRSGRIMIPWEHAEHAYVEYSRRFGTSQSLERLHQQGGFEVREIIMFLCDRLGSQEERLEIQRVRIENSRAEISRLRRKLRESGL